MTTAEKPADVAAAVGDQPNHESQLSVEDLELLKRLKSVPGVTSIWDRVAAVYDDYGRKSSISVVSNATNFFEENVRTVMADALSKHGDKLTYVDRLACDQLDAVSARVRDLGLEEKTKLLRDTVQQLHNQANATYKTATDTAAKSAADVEKQLCTPILRLLSDGELLVFGQAPSDDTADKPAIESAEVATEAATSGEEKDKENAATDPNTPQFGQEFTKVLAKARDITSKSRARALERAMASTEGIRLRTQSAVDELRRHSVDLINYASELRDSLLEDDDEAEEDISNVESTGAITTTEAASTKPKKTRRISLKKARKVTRETILLIIEQLRTVSSHPVVSQSWEKIQSLLSFYINVDVSLSTGTPKLPAIERDTVRDHGFEIHGEVEADEATENEAASEEEDKATDDDQPEAEAEAEEEVVEEAPEQGEVENEEALIPASIAQADVADQDIDVEAE